MILSEGYTRLVSEKQGASDTAYRYTGWDRLALPTQANAQTQPAIQPQLDPSGRTVQDAQYRYHYDVWGKLQSVTDAKADNKVIASYAHNAYGERVKASHGGQTRYYLYDNQKRVAELDQNGRILQQYLYLNDKPIAVLDSRNRGTEVIALHTDRRGAPVAASNERGKVIWTASYSAWGRAKVQTVSTAANDATFNLDLRLPGQWEDRATHLHYNYQRDYDPGTGRYLTPDPLGFPDGPDAYLYVGGDPVNRVDPLGLYSTEVHYYLTYFLARVSGLSELQARTVASAAQFIDDNDFTRPLRVGPGHERRLALYHFTYSDAEIAQEAINFPSTNRFLNSNNAQISVLLSYANRNILCTKAQLFGEYLHAFQDSFAHREPDNSPFTVGGGVGHGLYGEDPDSTFDVIRSRFSPRPSFTFNDEKAIAMEQAVFESFHTNFRLIANDKDGFPIDFSTIRITLLNFNAIRLRGDNRAKWAVLDSRLKALGLGGIPTYNEAWARNARRRNLVDSQGNPLNPIEYPNAILQTE